MDIYGYIWTMLILDSMVLLAVPAEGGRKHKKGHSTDHAKKNSGKSREERISEGHGAILNKLLLNYKKSDPPCLDKSTEVKLGIYVNSFYSISEQTMDYSVNIYLRQSWYDPRLQYEKVTDDPNEMLKLQDGMWDILWVPDVFFRNEKKASFHRVTIPNRLMRLFPDGRIWYATKISATLSCPMFLQKYPLDTQTCPMMLESFGHTMKTVYFSWWDKPIDWDKSISLPQFTLVDVELIDCSQNYSTGSYPCRQYNFVLQRDIGYFLIQVYIPSILIVILSWVAFWINIDAIPARVSLGLLTVLAVTTQSAGARSSLPRVSYIKAIDVWMSVCLVFVFASLLEFAVVNVFSRKEPRTIKPIRRQPKNRDPEAIPMGESYGKCGGLCGCCPRKMKILESGADVRDPPRVLGPDGKARARKVDKVSRKAFPAAFLIFNIFYWVMYTVF